MARYPLNHPPDLRNEASKWAERQGISLNQFILWSVAEKVGQLRGGLDDERFIGVTYRRGASGLPTPVISGTGIRVQSIVVAARHWNLSIEQIAAEYGLSARQVEEILRFYEAHRDEIDMAIEAERRLAAAHA
jgi:uncharacterized protein (DUF433 family)